MVEIDPRIEWTARYFKLPTIPRRLRVVIDDGARYLAASGGDPGSYRCRWLRCRRPSRSPRYPALLSGLSRPPFRSRALAVNHLGRNRGYQASLERIATAFDGRTAAFPSCDSGNAITFAAAGEPRTTIWKRCGSARQLPSRPPPALICCLPDRLQMANSLPGGRLRLTPEKRITTKVITNSPEFGNILPALQENRRSWA